MVWQPFKADLSVWEDEAFLQRIESEADSISFVGREAYFVDCANFKPASIAIRFRFSAPAIELCIGTEKAEKMLHIGLDDRWVAFIWSPADVVPNRVIVVDNLCRGHELAKKLVELCSCLMKGKSCATPRY